MKTIPRDLDFFLFVINSILGIIGQEFNTPRKRSFNHLIPCVVVFSSLNALFLVNCLSKMKNLDKVSEILWILPLIIQYCSKAVNGEWQRELFLDFIQWMRRVSQMDQYGDPVITRNLQGCQKKFIKVARVVFM